MYQLDNKKCMGWAVVAALLVLVTGCVTPGPIKPKTGASKVAISESASVTQLKDDRDGFIITETVKLNNTARKDFAQAVAMLDNQQYAPAIGLLEKITAQSPGITAPYINLGIAYQKTGKKEKAEAQFKKALELMPGHPVASNQYGLLCRKAGRFEQARTIYERALTDYPNYYPVHRNLGILCDLYLNDLESALTHYQAYSQAMPEDKQIKLWIADLTARVGKQVVKE